MRTHRWTVYGGLIVLATAMTGAALRAQDHADLRWRDDCRDQDDRGWGARYCDIRVQRLARGSGTLSVDGRENGGVEIAAGKGDSVVVRALVEAQAATGDAARALADQVRIVSTGGSIHAEGPPSDRHNSWSVSYRIDVPVHTDLTLRTINGPVSVEGVVGHMDLQAVNGPIDLDRVGGDVHARAHNGPLDVTLAGSRWDGVGLDAETENGPVDLRIPDRYAAHLETGTVNGPMDIDFPVTVQGRIDLRHIAMDVGGGGPSVRVLTTNGPVSVRKE